MLALCASLGGGCGRSEPASQAKTPASAGALSSRARSSRSRADVQGVPEDFPAMLGCTPEEIAGPSDPAVQAQLQRICDVTQAGLYALSQDTTVSADEQTTHALMMMGSALDHMNQVLAASGGADAGSPVQP